MAVTRIKTLLAFDGALVRGALAFVLTRQQDIAVVAELDRSDEIAAAICETQPDVAIVDFDLVGPAGPPTCGTHPQCRCSVLMLVDPRRSGALSEALQAKPHPPTVGFLGNHVAPQRVVDGVRRLSRGEPVVDGELVLAALKRSNPLTSRELDVLRLAAEGYPVREIASTLALAPGTVRNYLSRIVGKVGGRTRIEAVRIAREAGWL